MLGTKQYSKGFERWLTFAGNAFFDIEDELELKGAEIRQGALTFMLHFPGGSSRWTLRPELG